MMREPAHPSEALHDSSDAPALAPASSEVADKPRPIAQTDDALARLGQSLADAFTGVLTEIFPTSPGPAIVGRRVGIDKVLASRILKAVQGRDPLAALHAMPGPAPLRRALRAFARHGASTDVVRRASEAIDHYEALLSRQEGGRGSLDTLLSAWVPEARQEFELRRKQSAFRAISQLKGVETRLLLGTVILHPSGDGEHLDVVWLTALYGLHRLRPGALVRLATRRVARGQDARHPRGLDGREIEAGATPLVDAFCSSPLPAIAARHAGDVVHYTLADDRFGSSNAVDLVLGEANFTEMERRPPAGSGRVPWFFCEVSTPAKVMQFDAVVHRDVYPHISPRLRLYETAFEGVASPNAPARDVDVLDMGESIQDMGPAGTLGPARWRSRDATRYADLLGHAFNSLGWNPADFRAYRCRIEYPIFGTQVTMMFGDPVRGPGEPTEA